MFITVSYCFCDNIWTSHSGSQGFPAHLLKGEHFQAADREFSGAYHKYGNPALHVII